MACIVRASTFSRPLRGSAVQMPPARNICTHAVRQVEGKVVSAKNDKTAVVLVRRYKINEKYGKRILRSKKYHCHDEMNMCAEGDVVSIQPGGVPRSKTKTAEVVKIIRKGIIL